MVRTVGAGLLLAALLALVQRTAVAADSITDTQNVDKMKAALRTGSPTQGAIRPKEDKFIDDVIALVRKGTLPASIVDTSFQWAKRKPKHRFQYFEYALIAQASQAGIHIDPVKEDD